MANRIISGSGGVSIPGRLLARRLRELADAHEDGWTPDWPYRAWAGLTLRQGEADVSLTDLQVHELCWLRDQAGGWIDEDGQFLPEAQWIDKLRSHRQPR